MLPYLALFGFREFELRGPHIWGSNALPTDPSPSLIESSEIEGPPLLPYINTIAYIVPAEELHQIYFTQIQTM